VWYRRTFELPGSWKDKRVFLHFGAVDYECRAWVNGTPVGKHTYTQLTDVEQEVNGVYTYDRKPKFDIARLKTIFGAPAAIERP